MVPAVSVFLSIGVAALLLDGALLAMGSPWAFRLGIPLRKGTVADGLLPSEPLPRQARGTQALALAEGQWGYFSNAVRIGFRAQGMSWMPGGVQRAFSGMGVPASGVITVTEQGVHFAELLRPGPLLLALSLMAAGACTFGQVETGLTWELLIPVPFFGAFFGLFAILGARALKQARRELVGWDAA